MISEEVAAARYLDLIPNSLQISQKIVNLSKFKGKLTAIAVAILVGQRTNRSQNSVLEMET
jgi:hypothetical protein